MMERYDFKIKDTAFDKKNNKEVVNRRFHKVRYTAALRFGIVLEVWQGALTFSFKGAPTTEVLPHRNNIALRGELTLENESFDDVILIVSPNDFYPDRPKVVTFWPITQDPDAKDSYTDPLVDTAMGGSPYDINRVATVMHEKFKKNAGVSPAYLMKILYDEETQGLKELAEKTGELLNKALEQNKELDEIAKQAIQERNELGERAERERAEKNQAISDSLEKDEVINTQKEEIARLQQQALMKPTRGESVTESNVAKIDRVEEGFRGRSAQKAIILHMSDGTERVNNWERDYDARLQLAKTLQEEGRLVRTDVWNMPGTNYKWQNWFKNIYVVD
jgi:hypothetical protein